MDSLATFLKRRPAIRLHYEHAGSFGEYARRFRSRIPLQRGGRLITLIADWAEANRPVAVERELLVSQLTRYPLVSSADHAGILNYSILYNANLLFSGLLDSQALTYQVVLASTRIPLNNASHPRGIRLAGVNHNFFGKDTQRQPVALVDPGIEPVPSRGLAGVFRPDSLKQLDREQVRFLEHLFLGALDLEGVCRREPRFDHQLSHLNARLWPHYFHKECRMARTKLLYIPNEAMTCQLAILDLDDPESLLARIVFDPQVREIYLEEFDGITGCWSAGRGTHFFWAVDERRRLLPLRLNEDATALEVPAWALGEGVQQEPIPLDPPTLRAMLGQRQLLPSLFVEMLELAFVEGFTLMGGFNQVTYLAWMRVAHERAMLRVGDWPQAAWFARTPTDGLICGPLPFPDWESGIDLIWHHNAPNGRFAGGLDGGLRQWQLDDMMAMPLRTMIQNGVEAMLDIIE